MRLAVLGYAATGPVDLDRLATRLSVKRRTVAKAAGRLRAAGLLDDMLELDRETFRLVAASLPQAPPPGESVTAQGVWTPDEAEILSRFFSGERLTAIPSNLTKRRVVLDRLAQEFEPGLRYQEAEVNFMLQLWHVDHAALRRSLVDEGFLTRADGVYWRTGGRFESPDRGESA